VFTFAGREAEIPLKLEISKFLHHPSLSNFKILFYFEMTIFPPEDNRGVSSGHDERGELIN